MFGLSHDQAEALIYEMHSKNRVPQSHCDICGTTRAEALFQVQTGEFPLGCVLCAECGTIRLSETLPYALLEDIGKHGGALVHGLAMDEALLARYFDRQVERAARFTDYLSEKLGSLSGWRV